MSQNIMKLYLRKYYEALPQKIFWIFTLVNISTLEDFFDFLFSKFFFSKFFFIIIFFKGSMHRGLGVRIDSPHFFRTHAQYLLAQHWACKFFFIRTQTHTMGLFSPPRYSIFSGDHGLLVVIGRPIENRRPMFLSPFVCLLVGWLVVGHTKLKKCPTRLFL